MLYRPLDPATTTISGRNVAHGKRTARQRAQLAIALITGHTIVTPLTTIQAAAICRVSYPTIADVRRQRSESLAQHFARASQTERLEAARELGATAIWDELLNPLLV